MFGNNTSESHFIRVNSTKACMGVFFYMNKILKIIIFMYIETGSEYI